MKLSARLMTCAELVEGDNVCDVGTDHGYLPAYLILSGKCSHAIAADINPMPLEAAKRTAAEAGVNDRMEFYLSDGLEGIPLDNVTDIVAAGMGGELIHKILTACAHTAKCKAFILQPMTKAEFLRSSLAESGFEIIREKAAVEGRFVYTVMRCLYTGNCRSVSQAESITGKLSPVREEDRRYVLSRLEAFEKAAAGMEGRLPDRAESIRLTISSIRKEWSL